MTVDRIIPASAMPKGTTRSLPYLVGCYGQDSDFFDDDSDRKRWLAGNREALHDNSRKGRNMKRDFSTRDQMRGAWFEVAEQGSASQGFLPGAFRARALDGGPMALDSEPGCSDLDPEFSLARMERYCTLDPDSKKRPRTIAEEFEGYGYGHGHGSGESEGNESD